MFVHEGLLHSLPDVTYDWIMAMRRRKGKVRVPKGEMRALVLAVLDEPSAPPIDIPADLMPAPRPNVTITPCLELTMDKAGVWTRMWFDYGGFEVAYDDPRPQMLDVDSWTRIERDRVRELELVEEVGGSGSRSRGRGSPGPGQPLEPPGPAQRIGLDYARPGQAAHSQRAHGRDPGQQRNGLV